MRERAKHLLHIASSLPNFSPFQRSELKDGKSPKGVQSYMLQVFPKSFHKKEASMSDLLLENPEFIEWVAGRGDSKRKERRRDGKQLQKPCWASGSSGSDEGREAMRHS